MTTQLQIRERKDVEAAALAWARSLLTRSAEWAASANANAQATRMLRELALRGPDQALAVVGMAERSRLAHDVLHAIAREDIETGNQRSTIVAGYFVKTTAPGWKFPRRHGPRPVDDTLRNGAIVMTVGRVHRYFGLPIMGEDASACSIVGEALAVLNDRKSAKRVFNIWTKWRPIIASRISVS